jgi:hypothetical protein
MAQTGLCLSGEWMQILNDGVKRILLLCIGFMGFHCTQMPVKDASPESFTSWPDGIQDVPLITRAER